VASKDAAAAAKEQHSAELLARPGVSGVGTARGAGDGWVIEVHVDPGAGSRLELPDVLDGVEVRVIEDGPFRAGPARFLAG
jgi:hypothetical protein